MGDRTWDLAHRRPRTNQLWLCSHIRHRTNKPSCVQVTDLFTRDLIKWSGVNRVSGPILQFQLVRVRVALNFNHIFESYLALKIVIRP